MSVRKCTVILLVVACVCVNESFSDDTGTDYAPYRLMSSLSSVAAEAPLSRLRSSIRQTTARLTPNVRSDNRTLFYEKNLDSGLTIVLPGVFGKTPYNTRLISLLKETSTAVEYYDWTKGVPLFMRRGLSRDSRNSAAVREIAMKIESYQDRYPGRPVYVVGLCAGAGLACEALTRLSDGRRIESAILLGPALSADYDLAPALKATRRGIDSFHSPLDIPVLMALTTFVGTIDGRHMPAAGAIGFLRRTHEKAKLRQHIYNPKMLMQGHLGGHFGWTATKFVGRNVVPIIHQPQIRRVSLRQK